MWALFNAQASVKSLLDERLMPQTTFAKTYVGGKLHLIRLDDPTNQVNLTYTNGLAFRLREQPQQSKATVYNEFIIDCGRSLVGSGAPFRILRDPQHGPLDVRELLEASQKKHGRKPYLKIIEAADLALIFDADGLPVGCPAGERLGNLYAVVYANEPVSHAYQADRLRGLALERGDRATIPDAVGEGFVAATKLSATDSKIVVEAGV